MSKFSYVLEIVFPGGVSCCVPVTKEVYDNLKGACENRGIEVDWWVVDSGDFRRLFIAVPVDIVRGQYGGDA